MAEKFLCPHCRLPINIGDNILFVVNKKNSSERGIISLSAEFGNYKVVHNNEFVITEGEKYDFYCPLCHKNFGTKGDNKYFAKIAYIDIHNSENEIYFSEIAGMKCTYKVKNDKVESFGEDSDEFINFFGENPRY